MFQEAPVPRRNRIGNRRVPRECNVPVPGVIVGTVGARFGPTVAPEMAYQVVVLQVQPPCLVEGRN